MIAAGSAVTDTTGDAAWVPVTVTAVLDEPVAGLAGNPAHLDGPLAWAACLAHVQAHGHCSLPPPGREAADFALPLATWTAPAPAGADPAALTGDGLAWGWACSRALYEPGGHATVQVRKHPETGPAARYARDRSWDLSSGPLKARDVPFAADLVREIRWHALGEPSAIRVMLARVHALGRLAGHGHGAVASWRVEAHAGRDAWRDRVFPLAGGAPAGIRAPYWHLSRRMQCTP